MILLIRRGTISGTIARDVFQEMLTSPKDPKTIVEEKGWEQITDTTAIESAVDEVLAHHQQQVAKYLSGNEKLFGFFVGETMKKMKGKASPALVNAILKKKLQRSLYHKPS
jgi:aspartyl-tRNA(Asn)/glutamyl-tRNA(Gln) amidotransferase subunit B